MKQVLIAGAIASLLSGCSAEMMIGLPVAAIAAPIILPIEAAEINASITQPVAVVSASGRALASPPASSVPAKATFKTTQGHVRCTGSGTSGPPNAGSASIPVSCSNGMRGRAQITGNITVGYRFFMDLAGARDTGILCNGNYRATGDTAGPFLVSCQYMVEEYVDFNKTRKQRSTVAVRQAAVSAGPTASGGFTVTAWVQGK